jgi:hypothetical protein
MKLDSKHPFSLFLRVLDLSHNSISNVGAETLCSSLHRHAFLIYLNLSVNGLDDRALIAIAALIKNNSAIEVIECTGNRFSEKGILELGKALVSNSESKLYLLKLGVVKCVREEVFDDFIRMVSQSDHLRLLLLETPHTTSHAIKPTNQSSSFVYVIADKPGSFDSVWTLHHYCATTIALDRRSLGQSLLGTLFDKLEREPLNHGEIEQLVVVFQTLVSPNLVL